MSCFFIITAANSLVVDIELFRYHGCVKMIDMFHWSNIYLCSSSVRELKGNENMMEAVLAFATKPSNFFVRYQNTETILGQEKPDPTVIWRILSAFRAGVTVKQIVGLAETLTTSIDIR
jgi:hypothetical protein